MHGSTRSIALSIFTLTVSVFASTHHAKAFPVTIYVDDDAPTPGDGLTWASAFPFLFDALIYAHNPQHDVAEIRIAQGSYQPDRDWTSPGGTGNRGLYFELRSGLAVRGGYAGLGAIDPDARDIQDFETILSGDLAENDGAHFTHMSENSYRIVRAANLSESPLLEGFTIRGAAPGQGAGGALELINASPSISQCTITNNTADGYTANNVITVSNGSPTFVSCVFRDNSAIYSGKLIGSTNSSVEIRDSSFMDNRMTVVSLGGTGQPTIANCIFDDNEVGISIGGTTQPVISNCSFSNHRWQAIALGSSSTITDCSFVDNPHAISSGITDANAHNVVANSVFEGQTGSAVWIIQTTNIAFSDCQFIENSGDQGGAIYSSSGGAMTVDRCVFRNNYSANYGALGDGGAIRLMRTTCTLTDCEFQSNLALNGGAVFNDSGQLTAVNCRFQDNFAEFYGGAIGTPSYVSGPNSTSTLINCAFFRNEAAYFGGAIYSAGDDLKVVNCTLAANDALAGGGVYHGAGSTARIHNSIVSSNSGGSLGGPGARAVRYSNIAGGFAGVGNINVDPKFRNIALGNLKLKAGSKCIDAGRKSYLPADILTDLAGKPRLVDAPGTPNTGAGSPPVDMGAYEFQRN